MRSHNGVTERVEDADEEQTEQSSTHTGQEHRKQCDVEPVDGVRAYCSRDIHKVRAETLAYCTKDG